MTDRIVVRDLLLRTFVGINNDERVNRQDVVLNLTLHVDTRPAASSDDIADAINYRTIAKNVIAHVEQSRYMLVETMAEEVARLCLSDKRVKHVEVAVEKPTALRFARSVGVVIERSQDSV